MDEPKKKKINPVSVVAEIGKIETMSDGLKMTVYTNEVASEEMATLMKLKGKQGNMLFAPAEHEFTDEDLVDLPEVKVEEGQKTPGQRLRAVIFRLWERVDPGKKKTFEQYYREYMERLIDKIKEQLN